MTMDANLYETYGNQITSIWQRENFNPFLPTAVEQQQIATVTTEQMIELSKQTEDKKKYKMEKKITRKG